MNKKLSKKGKRELWKPALRDIKSAMDGFLSEINEIVSRSPWDIDSGNSSAMTRSDKGHPVIDVMLISSSGDADIFHVQSTIDHFLEMTEAMYNDEDWLLEDLEILKSKIQSKIDGIKG